MIKCRYFLGRFRMFSVLVLLATAHVFAEQQTEDQRSYIMTVVEVPLRDGVKLAANLYRPTNREKVPVVLTITPYGRHIMHPVASAYARLGMAFVALDTRGRGDSGGQEAVFHGDINDTVDVIAWAAQQSFSDGQVAMRGNSYGGFNQWMAAAKGAPALKTITPAASVYPGLDFPMTFNVGLPYSAIWTGFTKGRMANFPLFGDQQYWRDAFSEVLNQGIPFRDIDNFVGLNRDLFDEWVAHPHLDDYWRELNPTDEEMAAIDMPILSVTGLFDGAQPGVLAYYNQHMANTSKTGRNNHYLIIGPYDHGGVTVPKARLGGLEIPEAGGINPISLYGEWLAWNLLDAPKPGFLKDKVMYYVVGANEWRSAPSLGEIPIDKHLFHLGGNNPTAVIRAGSINSERPGKSRVSYRFDPRDIDKANLGTWFDGEFLVYDKDVSAIDGDGFVFESKAFESAVEIIGQPRFEAMIGIDTPDADFRLRLYEVKPDGSSVWLSYSHSRARYREGLDKPVLHDDSELKPYVFDNFIFSAFRIQKGSKLRFVLDPPNSIYLQRNYNAAKPVAEQTPADALVSTIQMQIGGTKGARLTLPLRNVHP